VLGLRHRQKVVNHRVLTVDPTFVICQTTLTTREVDAQYTHQNGPSLAAIDITALQRAFQKSAVWAAR
jgi:hypothetical protein